MTCQRCGEVLEDGETLCGVCFYGSETSAATGLGVMIQLGAPEMMAGKPAERNPSITEVTAKPPQVLFIETGKDGAIGIGSPLGDNSWTDESEWAEVEQCQLRCFRFQDGKFETVDGKGNWTAVPGWYRT